MILATDVYYDEPHNRALAAGVLFREWGAGKSTAEFQVPVDGIAPYEPGAFYKRELPCLLALLAEVERDHLVEVVVVDSYVDLEPGHPGLGRRLYNALGGRVAVVGVAKSHYAQAVAAEVFRGGSKSPLYVTAAGMEVGGAADLIERMHGPHRIPTLLQRVDALSRGRKG